MKLLFWIFISLSSLQAMSRAAPPQAVAENIGVRTFQYEDLNRARPVLVELWYPTQQNGPLDDNQDIWIHPNEVRDGPIASSSQKYPLILFSPGHGGDRRTLSWLAEYLVKSGFMVASVEHHGHCFRNYNLLLCFRFWERSRDVTFALNQLLKDVDAIDSNRIGFVGYSLGGMTGLSLAGAKAQNVKEVLLEQKKFYREIDPELVEQVDFSEAAESYFEPRIKAVALLTPAAFIFPPQSLKDIKVPVALVASEADEVLPFKEHGQLLLKHLVPAKVKLFKDKISHFAFLNRLSKHGKEAAKNDTQSDSIDASKLAVHKEVGRFVSDFFRENLR